MKTNKLEKLFDRLREEGWYCGWAHTCCQSCAWMDVPDYFDAKYDKDGYLIREDKDGNEIEYEEVDLSKVLFNHEQDCCIDEEDWEGDEDDYYDMLENYDGDGTMPTFTPDQITNSTFKKVMTSIGEDDMRHNKLDYLLLSKQVDALCSQV